MSSLFSAMSIVSGVKEYIYRGFQQLPLVLAGVAFLFTATTGSIAFLNLFIGLAFVIPIVTYALQGVIGFIGNKFPAFAFGLMRSDVCGLVPPEGKTLNLYTPKTGATPIPSFWLMEIMFLFGFLISNAAESYQASGNCPESDAAERKKYHATYVLGILITLFVLVLAMRFRYQASCELSSLSFTGGGLGIAQGVIKTLMLLLFTGGTAGVLGYAMYVFARKCGARSGDLLGILSQFLPPSAYSQQPIVCTA
jgi:hypothetical protein